MKPNLVALLIDVEPQNLAGGLRGGLSDHNVDALRYALMGRCIAAKPPTFWQQMQRYLSTLWDALCGRIRYDYK